METTVDDLLRKIKTDMEQASILVENLRSIGYTSTFELVVTNLVCKESGKQYSSLDLHVDEIFRLDRFVDGFEDYFIYTLRARDQSATGIFAAFPVEWTTNLSL